MFSTFPASQINAFFFLQLGQCAGVCFEADSSVKTLFSFSLSSDSGWNILMCSSKQPKVTVEGEAPRFGNDSRDSSALAFEAGHLSNKKKKKLTFSQRTLAFLVMNLPVFTFFVVEAMSP